MRILVAEDHPTLARSVADGLREEGFAVDLTFNGDEAMRSANANPYDCLILDIMMPGKTGWQILESVRQRGSRTPVLFLTAADAVSDRVRGLNGGADDYVVKPFAFDELVARVRAVIRRGHGKAAGTIVVGDLEIDTAAKTVRRAGRSISLSAREFCLLEYLALRSGEVVSRTDIWQHLYDESDENVSNVVDVYIGYLRNKIDRDHEVKLIHTRRGMGYMVGEKSQ
jgi:DNA-binding response OmpR family regulator